jgi:hypothetical protein
MRQFSRGYVDEILTVTVRQIRIVKGYGGIFLLGAAALVLGILLLALVLSLLVPFGGMI